MSLSSEPKKTRVRLFPRLPVIYRTSRKIEMTRASDNHNRIYLLASWCLSLVAHTIFSSHHRSLRATNNGKNTSLSLFTRQFCKTNKKILALIQLNRRPNSRLSFFKNKIK